jgi:hypothetical protein
MQPEEFSLVFVGGGTGLSILARGTTGDLKRPPVQDPLVFYAAPAIFPASSLSAARAMRSATASGCET